jgi:hypothetical protein
MKYRFAFQFENIGYNQASNIKELSLLDTAPPASNYFPLRYYPSNVSAIVGIRKDKYNTLTLIKYFMTSVEAVNKVKEADVQLLGELIKEENKAFLFDSIKKQFITPSSFSTPFPPKFQSIVYAYSDSYKQIFSIKEEETMGILAAFYLAQVYIKNPGYKGYSSAAKKLIYNWTCVSLGYPINNKIDICSLEWPSNGPIREVSLPDAKYLRELQKLANKIPLKVATKPEEKQSSVEAEETISLLRMMNTGAVIQQREIDNSDKIVIVFDIDAPSFEFLSSAYIKDGSLIVSYYSYGKDFLNQFYSAIGWKDKNKILEVEEENIRASNIGQYDFNGM